MQPTILRECCCCPIEDNLCEITSVVSSASKEQLPRTLQYAVTSFNNMTIEGGRWPF